MLVSLLVVLLFLLLMLVLPLSLLLFLLLLRVFFSFCAFPSPRSSRAVVLVTGLNCHRARLRILPTS